MKVVILAGGYGTRLAEETEKIPKPMVTIGGVPILWHIIRNFADQGFHEFVIAAGYKWETVRDWVKEHFLEIEGANITVHDTGLDTATGGRVARTMHSASVPFILTYGDGLADINYNMLIEHHSLMVGHAAEHLDRNKPLVTLSAVNPPSRFGRLRIEDGMCKIFTEKGQDPEGWINAGYYVCDPQVVRLIPGDNCVWEKDILPTLALQGRLSAFQHTGEFQMMDTWRDRKYLEELWEKGSPFWTKWSR
jgi:glucose-1-phosphate cytidylyltransferase